MKSVNHMLVTKPYEGSRGVKSKIQSGVSVIQQKTGVLGLEVLIDAEISKDVTVKAGSIVYIKEEVLYTYKDMYSQTLDCTEIGESFILANYSHVLFVKE